MQVIGVGDTTVISTTTTDEEGAQTTEQIPRTLLTLAVDQDEAERCPLRRKERRAGLRAAHRGLRRVKSSAGVTAADMFR